MDMNAVSRRSFLGGSLSLGALVGCRAFRAPTGLFAGDAADLTLGVVSDIHVDAAKGDFRKFGDAAQFEKALRWFDAQGVDGVVVAGDMTENGMLNQLECVGEAWFRVFPDGCSTRDGRPVEQLFVYGNHDVEGQTYDKFDVRYFHKPSFEAAQIRRDPAEAWRRVFHEDYVPIWLKCVKGYQFVGAHWSLGKDAWGGIPEVEDWFRANAGRLSRDRPFFFIQHCHPKDTVYGAEAWCPDKGYATRALSAFPNAVAMTGHSHASLTDERSIWQGAFTSVGTASLRYGGDVDRYEQRQGLLLKVYEDRMVFVRRDFLHDASLGDDWVVPLPVAEAKPFSFEVRRAKDKTPEFPAGAQVACRREKNGWLLTIPSASAGRARAFRYEISLGLVGEKGQPLVFRAYDAKYNMPLSLAGSPTRYLVKDSALPKDAAGKARRPERFVVTPLGCFDNRGQSLTVSA